MQNSTAVKTSQEVVMDGSDIMELVENDKAFTDFVHHKFHQLRADSDGNLSLQELHPAVNDVGLPPHATSPQSHHIYSEVLDEYTHGRQEKISKTQFEEVLSDIFVGMAAGLKRDPVVILRIDGDDLHEFINSSTFEPEILSLFSEINTHEGSLKDYIIKAFEKLSVDQGMPPATDPWVLSYILEPALENLGDSLDETVSQETFLADFKRAAEYVAGLLKEQPAIVAHSQNTFDGSGIRRLLSNKFELEKALDSAVKSVPSDHNAKVSKECLSVVIDNLAASVGLPPLGAVDQIDGIIAEALKMFEDGDGKTVKEEELKKVLTEVLESIMVKLEGKPVSISINSVVHEPQPSSSAPVQPSLP